MLVRGEDRFGHFLTPPVPTGDFTSDAMEMCTQIDKDQVIYYYQGTTPRHR